MKFYAITSITLTATLFTLSHLSTTQEPGSVIKKARYHHTGVEGTIAGTVTLTGQAPQRRVIDMSADPVCVAMNSEVLSEDAIVNDGKIANVFVYIKSGDALDLYSFPQPDLAASTAVLAHQGCRYQPHVLAIRAGEQLAISNRDPTPHNTHPTPKENPEFNVSQAVTAPPLSKVFPKPETFIPFKDNHHPWEKAYLGVFAHPFFAITDESGEYRIEGLPPGRYTLVAWHERFGEKTIEITVAPSETRNHDFTFAAAIPGKSSSQGNWALAQ